MQFTTLVDEEGGLVVGRGEVYKGWLAVGEGGDGRGGKEEGGMRSRECGEEGGTVG